MGKGDETRQTILDEALALCSQVGVSGLSIGSLADKAGMSKSGVFAHFGSKEELQIAVMRESQQRFVDIVVRPALKAPRGIARLRAIFTNWLDWTERARLPGGCPMNAAANEFDDQPGPVRDAVEAGMADGRRLLAARHRHRPVRLRIHRTPPGQQAEQALVQGPGCQPPRPRRLRAPGARLLTAGKGVAIMDMHLPLFF